MRERADYFTVQHGRPPTVLLVPLGSARAAAVRLGFAGDLLRPAGIEGAALDAAGEQAPDDVLAEALQGERHDGRLPVRHRRRVRRVSRGRRRVRCAGPAPRT